MASGGQESSTADKSCSLGYLPTTPSKPAVPRSPADKVANSHTNSCKNSINSSFSNSPGSSPSPKKATTKTSDRYIPRRLSGEKLELSQYLLKSPHRNSVNSSQWTETEDQRDMQQKQKALSESLAGNLQNAKILNFSSNLTKTAGNCSPFTELVSLKPIPSKRTLPSMPEKILDAPNVLDDYYFDLLCWSKDGVVAVALNNSTYLWTSEPADTHLLMHTFGNNNCVASVAFDRTGQFIAIGTSECQLELYDVSTKQHLRSVLSHDGGRIAALSWSEEGILASGGQDGNICIYDFRESQPVNRFRAHTNEVCGIAWSPNGRLLASGGSDKIVNVWTYWSSHDQSRQSPVFSTNKHLATVKALSWCPWRHQTLTTGGGYEDGYIYFWNTSSNTCESSIKMYSQVCCLTWAPHFHELIAGLGTPNNCASVWQYRHPSVKKIKDLTHSGRVLGMAMNPNKSVLATLCGDECLRFWRCFGKESEKNLHAKNQPLSLLRSNIIR